MLKPVFFVAFSGHRPDDTPGRTDEALEATAPWLKRTLESLRERVNAVDGELHFISGVAAGADIVACEVARSLGIPLHVILPKPEDEFLLVFSGRTAAWKPRALALLDIVRPSENHDASHSRNTCRIGGVSRKSPDCYAEANAQMLDVADLLLTVSNGVPSKSIAGTTHLIAQAEALRLPQINIDPTARSYSEAYRENRLAGFAAGIVRVSGCSTISGITSFVILRARLRRFPRSPAASARRRPDPPPGSVGARPSRFPSMRWQDLSRRRRRPCISR